MNVRIRPLKEQDAYTSVKWRNDPEVFKFTGNIYNHEITIDNELEWIRKVTANPTDYRCAILVDEVYVGNIYLTDIKEVLLRVRNVNTSAYNLYLRLGFKDVKVDGIWTLMKLSNL